MRAAVSWMAFNESALPECLDYRIFLELWNIASEEEAQDRACRMTAEKYPGLRCCKVVVMELGGA